MVFFNLPSKRKNVGRNDKKWKDMKTLVGRLSCTVNRKEWDDLDEGKNEESMR